MWSLTSRKEPAGMLQGGSGQSCLPISHESKTSASAVAEVKVGEPVELKSLRPTSGINVQVLISKKKNERFFSYWCHC